MNPINIESHKNFVTLSRELPSSGRTAWVHLYRRTLRMELDNRFILDAEDAIAYADMLTKAATLARAEGF